MARTKQTQARISKSFTSRGSTPRSMSALVTLVACALTVVWATAMLSPFGNLMHAFMFAFIVFYAGPVTLVSLSLTVMAGLVATDRIVLLIRHRVLLQSTHRTMGIIAVFGLVLHVLTKITAGYVSASTAFLPFVTEGTVYIGLGTVAAVLMVSVLWTGLIRARFVGIGKPWVWRALHSTAYLAWPVALVHGLNAGRAAATWVTVSYVLCVALVVAALLVRLSVSLGRKREEQGQNTGSMTPVGKAARPSADARTAVGGSARRRTTPEPRTARPSSARSAPAARTSRSDTATRTGRGAPEGPVRRPRRESFGDLRDDRTATGIDSWASAGVDDTTESPRRRSNRFAVPEVPPAGSAEAESWPNRRRPAGEPGEPGDSRDGRRGWATSEPEPPWDSPRRWATDHERDRDRYTDRYRRPDPTDDRAVGGPALDDRGRPDPVDERQVASPTRRRAEPSVERPAAAPGWDDRRRADPLDERPAAEPGRERRRRRAAEEEPVEERTTGRSTRHKKKDDDADDESTAGWGRAARYDPNLSDNPELDDDTPTLVGLANRRARKTDGGPPTRSSRRKQADEVAAAEEGAYWTKLKGEAK